MPARPADAPNVLNYCYGSGILRYRPAGQPVNSKYETLGNSPTLTVKLLAEEKPHFSATTDENDHTRSFRRGGEVNFSCDEINSANFALMLGETATEYSGHTRVPIGSSKPMLEWEVQVEIPDVTGAGSVRVYHFWRCLMRPENLGEYSDGYTKWSGTFAARRDDAHSSPDEIYGWADVYDKESDVPLS